MLYTHSSQSCRVVCLVMVYFFWLFSHGSLLCFVTIFCFRRFCDIRMFWCYDAPILDAVLRECANAMYAECRMPKYHNCIIIILTIYECYKWRRRGEMEKNKNKTNPFIHMSTHHQINDQTLDLSPTTTIIHIPSIL